MKYRISRPADKDIEQICSYIAEDNPAAADQLDERIHKAIKMLARLPGIGHSRADIKDKRYLFWAVNNYVIAYRLLGKELTVVRVVHGGRDFRKPFKHRR